VLKAVNYRQIAGKEITVDASSVKTLIKWDELKVLTSGELTELTALINRWTAKSIINIPHII
jgi:hypothetical protein